MREGGVAVKWAVDWGFWDGIRLHTRVPGEMIRVTDNIALPVHGTTRV